MKVDRILEIIIYLINHDNVPASDLAERFHVSVRTIQRDMVSISSIGIPVYLEGGKYGGYSILPTYKMKNSDKSKNSQSVGTEKFLPIVFLLGKKMPKWKVAETNQSSYESDFTWLFWKGSFKRKMYCKRMWKGI